MAGVKSRGTGAARESLFSYRDLEARPPARHPLRNIRQVVNVALASLNAELEAIHADFGSPSTPQDRPIRPGLIHILFSVQPERHLTGC